jgi:RNA polymerase sigma factor (sigma-70 family)
MRSSSKRSDEFGVVYRALAPKILVYFARRTFEAEVAADLTAETLTAAFVARSRFRGHSDAQVEAWMYRIAERQLSNWARSGRVQARAVKRLKIDVPSVTSDDVERIEQLADLHGMRRALADALDALPERQRDAVRLRVVDEASYEEIAQTMGARVDAVRMLVSRGLRSLADALESDQQITVLRGG